MLVRFGLVWFGLLQAGDGARGLTGARQALYLWPTSKSYLPFVLVPFCLLVFIIVALNVQLCLVWKLPEIHLPLLPVCWDYSYARPHPSYPVF